MEDGRENEADDDTEIVDPKGDGVFRTGPPSNLVDAEGLEEHNQKPGGAQEMGPDVGFSGGLSAQHNIHKQQDILSR